MGRRLRTLTVFLLLGSGALSGCQQGAEPSASESIKQTGAADPGPQTPAPVLSEQQTALLEQAKQYFDLGYRLMDKKSGYDEAELYLLLAVDAAQEAGGGVRLGQAYDALASLYGKTGDQRQAMEMHRRALEARGETAPTPSRTAVRAAPAPSKTAVEADLASGRKALLAQARRDFDVGYQLMNKEKRYAAAEPLMRAAVAAAGQAGDTHKQAYYLSWLSALYGRWEKPEQKERAARQMLTLHVGHENWEKAASVANNLGYAHLRRSEWGPAEDWFRKAIRYDFAAGKKTHLYLFRLGKSLMGADNLDGAEPVLKEALQLALEEEDYKQVVRVYDTLARLYDRTGDYRREREARGKAHEIRETHLKDG